MQLQLFFSRTFAEHRQVGLSVILRALSLCYGIKTGFSSTDILVCVSNIIVRLLSGCEGDVQKRCVQVSLRLLLSVVVICGIVACERSEPVGKNPYFHQDSIAQERKAKDLYWREGEASPLRAEDKALFQGLAYFPPQSAYCVTARFEAFPTQDTVRVLTSDNEVRLLLRAGRLHFVIGKDSCRLAAYRYTGLEGKMQRGYFVPFKDATNGTDTYRPGRYVDVDVPRANEPFVVDFNRAFNPYCNYNEEYSCPLVPQENILAVRIEAGEKVFFHPRK